MTDRTYCDLETAGNQLADTLSTHVHQTPMIVLAIANGGVPVAIPVAEKLRAPLDLVVIRRLFTADKQPGDICATSVANHLIFADGFGAALINPITPEDHFIHDALTELSRRVDEMRGDLAPKDIGGKHIILVDNGIHTGKTLEHAVSSVRSLNPAQITVAVPLADSAVKQRVEAIADRLVCLQWCEQFGHAGLWYKNFNRPSDAEISALLKRTVRKGVTSTFN